MVGFPLFLATFLLVAHGGPLKDFTSEVAAKRFPIEMIQKGTQNLKSVKFVSQGRLSYATALFYPQLHSLLLSDTLLERDRHTMKSLNAMGAVDAGVLVHELWHSFYQWDPRLRGLVMTQVNSIYGAYPKSKREEIQEEAYGTFIQKVATVFLNIELIRQRSTNEAWEKLRQNKIFVRSYETAFSESCFGYYQESPLIGAKKLVWSTVALPPKDKQFILSHLLEGRLSGHFEHDFPATGTKELF